VDQITSQVDQLAELNDEQVVELQSAIIGEFESLESQDISAEAVDAMTSLADMLEAVRGELTRREAAAEELTIRASEAAMRVKGEVTEDDMGDVDSPEGEVVPTDSMEDVDMPEDSEDMDDEDDKTKEMGDGKKMKKSMDEESFSSEEVVLETETVVASSDSDVELTETEEITELSSDTTDGETVVETSEEAELATSDIEVKEEVVSELSVEEDETSEVVELSTSEEVSTDAVENVDTELSSTESTPSNTIAQDEQKEQATVTASAEESFQAPADRQPVLQVSEPAKVAITAGADIPGYTAGSEIANMNEVAVAMEKRLHGLRRVNGGDGEQHIVASFSTQYPEERVLTTDPEQNRQRINAVVGQEAMTASGGHAAPFEVKYDIFGVGSTTDRPVRDSLPSFQADRGGIRFVTPPSILNDAYADAVGIWTSANDSAETPSPAAKSSLTVAAAAELTASTDAVTLQLQFGNLMTRAYPELIARHNELGLVQHAREAEVNLLTKIEAGSTAVS
jgi:hypothetical protein